MGLNEGEDPVYLALSALYSLRHTIGASLYLTWGITDMFSKGWYVDGSM